MVGRSRWPGVLLLSALVAVVAVACVPKSGNGATCTIVGTAGPDVLVGTEQHDVVCGLGGNDVLTGLGGDDVLDGGPGNDTLTGGRGGDTLLGAAGTDTASFADHTDPVVANLDGVANDGAAGEGDLVGVDVESLAGGSAADRLTGNAATNGIAGGAGGDDLDGGAGADVVAGQNGDDTVAGGPGTDWVDGNGGSNLCVVNDPSAQERSEPLNCARYGFRLPAPLASMQEQWQELDLAAAHARGLCWIGEEGTGTALDHAPCSVVSQAVIDAHPTLHCLAANCGEVDGAYCMIGTDSVVSNCSVWNGWGKGWADLTGTYPDVPVLDRRDGTPEAMWLGPGVVVLDPAES